MFSSTHLGGVMETTCDQCKSRFRITEKQLKQAYGKVCCGECGCVFNALSSLRSYDGELPADYDESAAETADPSDEPTQPVTDFDGAPPPASVPLSLQQAMYGDDGSSRLAASPLLWFIGILGLLALGLAQAVYYQRYALIEDPRFQQQVINLCQVLPCAPGQFSSTEQIRLLERNVFTHPVTPGALMVTGSFVNQAPFAQRPPDLLISLFDIQGNLIANRVFKPAEYLLDQRNRGVIEPETPIQFRLEIVDPGTDALTYEFEFL